MVKSRLFIILHFIILLSLVIAWTNIDNKTNSTKPVVITVGHKEAMVLVNPQIILPQYKTADVLLEDLGGPPVELLPPNITSNKLFRAFSVLEENGTYYLWLNTSSHNSGSIRPSVEQRFESQDGLVWQNRTDTNLTKNQLYKFVSGIRGIAKDNNIYEGWERYYYETSSGWATAIRYITSTNSITWTVVNEPALIGANYHSVIKDGATYRMWVHPSGDSNYTGSRALRYRTSSNPGSGWGHWQTGGTEVNLDGSGNNLEGLTQVRQGAGGTYELFYMNPIYKTQDILRLNKATGSDGLNFTTVITDMIDFNEVMPTIWADKVLLDFRVVDIGGEDWIYFTYCENYDAVGCIDTNIAVSRPVYAEIDVQDGGVSIPDDIGVVNFGATLVGTPIIKTLTVYNFGQGDLILTPPITVPVGYSLVNSFGTTTITPTGSTTFTVQLDATSVGPVSGTLVFDNNDLDENPYNIILNGTVNPNNPEIEVLDGVVNIPDNTGVVNFGTTLIGDPITKTFTVYNSEMGDLTLTPSITLPVGYSLVNSFGTAIVTPTGSTTFTVQLDATTTGAFSGILAFDNNDLDENPYNFTLSGSVNVATYLPVIFKNYTVGGDLVVESLIVNSSEVIVVIRNVDLNIPVTNPFRVDLYVDPDPVPTVINQPWTQVSSEGLVWNVTQTILPGGQLALTIDDPYYVGALSNYSGAPATGTPIYVQVDTFDNVLESHEISGGVYNNVKGVVVGP